MFRNKKILLLILFCNIWLSCSAKFKLQHIVEHVNRANVSWEVSKKKIKINKTQQLRSNVFNSRFFNIILIISYF